MLDCYSIGARVRHHRMRNGMSQEELAEKIDSSRVHISNIERGEYAPSLETIISIANALNATADDLLSGSLLVENSREIEEEMDVLYDCTQEESRILLLCMRAIKQILRGYKISE